MNNSISPIAALGSAVHYRDLIGRMVARDFAAKYRGSLLGPAWALASPLIMALVFVFVFGTVFKVRWGLDSTSESSFTVIFLVGMIVHGIFAEAVARAPGAVLANPSYVKKVVFPLEILPVIVVLNAIIPAAIGLAIVVAIQLVLAGTLSPTLPLLPLVLLPYLLTTLGLAYFLSSIGVYFRDLAQIVNLVTMASMFMAPIFYPISAVPEPYRSLLYLNPLTFPVEQTRAVVLFGRAPDFQGIAIYMAAGSALTWLGYAWFQKTRKGFADVL